MNARSPNARPLLRSAVALSVLLALGACSSDDDDADPSDTGTTDAGGGDAGGSDTGGTDGGATGGDDGGGGDEALTVSLGPDQEVPPVTTADGASGTASITLGEAIGDEGGALDGSITLSGLSGPARAAHIHRGFRGSNGPVLVALAPADGSDPDAEEANVTEWIVPDDAMLQGGATPESFAEAFARGELYFNVHTDANPGGEVRGQILPEGDAAPTFFTVRIENVSTETTLPTSSGSVAVPLSPGAYIVHREDANPLLEPRDPASEALEMVAEDGDPSAFPTQVPGSAAFDTPVGADAAGPIGPGAAYEFTVSGVPGDKLSLVTMFIESNDWFYTTTDEDDDSLSLFGDDGTPVSGDRSASLELWDAGTEQDQEPGTGADQAPRQAGPDTGAEEGGTVGSLVSQGKSVELNGSVVSLTVTPEAN